MKGTFLKPSQQWRLQDALSWYSTLCSFRPKLSSSGYCFTCLSFQGPSYVLLPTCVCAEMKGSSYDLLEIKSPQVSRVSAIFYLPLEYIFSMHWFWFPQNNFIVFSFFLRVGSSRSFTHELLSEITGAMLVSLQAACSLFIKARSLRHR